MGGKLDLLQQSRKRELQVNIDHHYASKVYNTGSPITGTVDFTPRKDTAFESIRISLVGTTRVRREDLDYPKTATHYFLRTDMSDSELVYPGSKVFRAGETYTMPFHFIVPDHLTTSACNHKVDSPYIRMSHTRMPPSMGNWTRDDMSLLSCSVNYSIQADIVTQPDKKNGAISSRQSINILPYSPEEPPLTIPDLSIQYALQKQKKMRRTIVSPVDGLLTAVAQQPRAIHLEANGLEASASEILVDLEFEAKSVDAKPPKLGRASATMHAQTWSRQRPNTNHPNMGLLRDEYVNCVPVLPKTPVEATWASESAGKGSDSDSLKSGKFHSALVRIPFKLPTAKRAWLPTFHSCLISRTYKADVSLEVGNTTLRFVVPVQIAMESLDFSFDAAEVDGWTPELGAENGWSEWDGQDLYGGFGPRALRAVGGDVLPSYTA